MESGQIRITRADGTTLLLHHGTPYRVNEFDPFDRGVRADQGGDAPWSDGGWSGAEWREPGTIPFKLGIHTSSWADLMDAWWALDAAMAPVRTGSEVELTWNAAGTEYLMYVRPRGVKLANQLGRTGKGWVQGAFAAMDPAIYSAAEHEAEMGLLNRIGGLVLPATAPFLFYQVVADGEATIVNAGTADARMLLHIDGPVVRPRITLIGAAGPQTMFLDTVLSTGEYLDIDTKDKVVLLNGITSRLADQYGAWPLLSGEALIRFEADQYNPDARLTVRWRDTY